MIPRYMFTTTSKKKRLAMRNTTEAYAMRKLRVAK